MGEGGNCRAEGLEDEDVFEGVGEVVLAADNVGDAQVGVIGAGGQMVGRHAVGAQEGEVFDVVTGLGLVAVDGVLEGDNAAGFAGDAEADDERLASRGPAVGLFLRHFALAGVGAPGLAVEGFFFVGGRCGGSEVAVGETFVEDGLGGLAVKVEAVGLPIVFVPGEAKPVETVEDGVDRGLCIAFDVGVVEAEDHRAAVAAGIEPVEDEGPGATDVEVAGGRRGETYAKHPISG